MSGESKREAARQRIAAKRAAEAAARAAVERRRRTVLGGVVAAAVLLVVLAVVVVVQTHRTSTAADAAAPANTAGNGYVFAVGSADAPVTVDLYEDFQCPNCKALEDSTGSTIDDLVTAGSVQVHYHGMAFLDTKANDRYSTRALNAAAVVANAAGTEAYATFHGLLFANQPDEGGRGLTDDQLIGYAAHPRPGVRRLGDPGRGPGQQGRRHRHADGLRRRREADRPEPGRADRRGHRRAAVGH
jgi:protein-disulfide isomerase